MVSCDLQSLALVSAMQCEIAGAGRAAAQQALQMHLRPRVSKICTVGPNLPSNASSARAGWPAIGDFSAATETWNCQHPAQIEAGCNVEARHMTGS